ncbi:MAG TPA: hypothetical protein VKH44_07245 [Pirellulaceae bacterium]|nr:hypothetical protein [Pirellulaceae bacterium]
MSAMFSAGMVRGRETLAQLWHVVGAQRAPLLSIEKRREKRAGILADFEKLREVARAVFQASK